MLMILQSAGETPTPRNNKRRSLDSEREEGRLAKRVGDIKINESYFG